MRVCMRVHVMPHLLAQSVSHRVTPHFDGHAAAARDAREAAECSLAVLRSADHAAELTLVGAESTLSTLPCLGRCTGSGGHEDPLGRC